MKQVYKSLVFMLVAVMVLQVMPTARVVQASNTSFSDVYGHWAQKDIEELASKGIVNGMGDGTYAPEGLVTRSQFMKLVVAVRTAFPKTETTAFDDVPTDSWSNPYVAEGLNRGIFSFNELNNDSFAPEDPMDRDTVALWITRAIGIGGADVETTFNDNRDIKNKSAVAIAVAEELVTGYPDNTYLPSKTLTRAESAVIIKRLLNKENEMIASAPEKNDVVLRKEVQKIEPQAMANVLVTEDEEAGYYVFENIDDNIRSLKPNQIFAIYPCSSVPKGISLKVDRIVINGNKAEIWEAPMELDDVFEDINISKSVDMSLADIDVMSIPEGVTVTNEKGQTVAEAKAERESGILLASSASDGGKLEKSGLKFTLAEVKVGPVVVGGTVTVLQPNIKIDLETEGATVEHCELKVDAGYKLAVSAKATGSATAGAVGAGNTAAGLDWEGIASNGKAKGELSKYIKKLAEMSLPVPGTPFFAEIDIFIGVNAKGEISLSYSYEEGRTIGFSYKKGSPVHGINEVLYTDHDWDLKLEGKIEVGPEIEVGISALKIVKIAFKSGLAAGIKGDVALSRALDKKHDCDVCIDGAIYIALRIGVTFKVGVGKLTVTLFSPTWEILNDGNATIKKFYVSWKEDRSNSVDWGWNECPHVKEEEETEDLPVQEDFGFSDADFNTEVEKSKDTDMKLVDQPEFSDADFNTEVEKSNTTEVEMVDQPEFSKESVNTEVDDVKEEEFDIIMPDF